MSDPVERNLATIEQGVPASEETPHTSVTANRTFETDICEWPAGDAGFVARSTASLRAVSKPKLSARAHRLP